MNVSRWWPVARKSISLLHFPSSLLLLEIALLKKVPQRLPSGAPRLREPCCGFLSLALEPLVMTSFLLIHGFRHLEPNILHNNQAYISTYRYKTSLDILNTAFMFAYLGKPNKVCVCAACLCRGWMGG